MSLYQSCIDEIKSLITQFKGIKAVYFTDFDGAVILKVFNDASEDSSASEWRMKHESLGPQILANGVDETRKLLGQLRLIRMTRKPTPIPWRVCMEFDHPDCSQVVQFCRYEIVVTVITNSQIEMGTVLLFENKFAAICKEIQPTVSHVLSQPLY